MESIYPLSLLTKSVEIIENKTTVNYIEAEQIVEENVCYRKSTATIVWFNKLTVHWRLLTKNINEKATWLPNK